MSENRIEISKEDLKTIKKAQDKVNQQLASLGLATRKIDNLKKEIDIILEQQQIELAKINENVTKADENFQNIVKLVAEKYDIDLNQKCDLNLAEGVFTVG